MPSASKRPARAVREPNKQAKALEKTAAIEALWSQCRAELASFFKQRIPDDSKSLFDRDYMNTLFEVGLELGKSGKAWRSRPAYDRTPPPPPPPSPSTRPAEVTTQPTR